MFSLAAREFIKRCENAEILDALNGLFELKADGIHRPVPVAAVESLIERLNRNGREEAQENSEFPWGLPPKLLDVFHSAEGKTEEQQGLRESGIRIPIGKKGREPHYFTLGYGGNNYHALVGGQTGWGKPCCCTPLSSGPWNAIRRKSWSCGSWITRRGRNSMFTGIIPM